MFKEEKYYQKFIKLTDAYNYNEIWIDTSKIVMMKPWLEKDGKVLTYLAMDTSFAVKVKESIEEIFKIMGFESPERNK